MTIPAQADRDAVAGELYHAAAQLALHEKTECALGIFTSDESQVLCGHCDDAIMWCFKVRRLRAAVEAVARQRNTGNTRAPLAHSAGSVSREDVAEETTVDDQAEAIIAAANLLGTPTVIRENVIELLRTALLPTSPGARREAIEDAARVAESYSEWCDNWGQDSNQRAADKGAIEIAAAIRNLGEGR